MVTVLPNKVVARSADDTLAEDLEREILNTPVEDKWAPIIGISKFQKNSINLKYPTKDARDCIETKMEEQQSDFIGTARDTTLSIG
jgi:hypothetical protein